MNVIDSNLLYKISENNYEIFLATIITKTKDERRYVVAIRYDDKRRRAINWQALRFDSQVEWSLFK